MPDGIDNKDLGQVVSMNEVEKHKTELVYRRYGKDLGISIVKVLDKDGGVVTIPFLETENYKEENTGEKNEKISGVIELVRVYGYPLLLATRMVYDRPDLIEKSKNRSNKSPTYLVGIVGRPHTGKTTIAKNSGMDVVNLDPFSNHESDTSLGKRLDKLIEEIASGVINTDLLIVDLPGKSNSRMEFDVYDDLAQAMDIITSPDSERVNFSETKLEWDRDKLLYAAIGWRRDVIEVLGT